MKRLKLAKTSVFATFTMIGILISAAPSLADGLDVRVQEDDQRSFIAVSGETASFTIDEGTISGMGAKLDYTYYFRDSFSADGFFSMAFSNDADGFRSSFTGFGGSLNYVLYGDCCGSKKTVNVEGRSVITETKKIGTTVKVGVGVDQFFLNGSQSVYPASGMSVGGSVEFGVWGQRVRLGARSALLTANSADVIGTFLNLGLTFPM